MSTKVSTPMHDEREPDQGPIHEKQNEPLLQVAEEPTKIIQGERSQEVSDKDMEEIIETSEKMVIAGQQQIRDVRLALLLPLTSDEAKSREDLEAKIKSAALEAHVGIGKALGVIKGLKLFKSTHTGFNDYTDNVWGISGQWAARLMDIAEYHTALSGIFKAYELPVTESALRELKKVPKEMILEILEITAKVKPPTAQQIVQARTKLIPEEKNRDKSKKTMKIPIQTAIKAADRLVDFLNAWDGEKFREDQLADIRTAIARVNESFVKAKIAA